MSDFDVTASVSGDDASLNALATKIADAVGRGLDGAARELSKTVERAMSEMIRKISADATTSKLRSVGEAMKDGFKGASSAAEEARRSQKQLIEDAENLAKTLGALRKVKYVDPDLFELAAQNIRKLQRLSADTLKTDFTDGAATAKLSQRFNELRRTSIDSLKTINRVSDQAATEARQSFQRQTDAANAAAREKNTILRTAGEKEILLQRQQNKVVEAEAQKAKGLAIANRQALWAALLRIESAGIAGLQGVAKTGVSAIGRVYDSTFGNITRTVAQKYSIINRTTSESFNKTEAITRSSLKRQETLFATSLSRQERLVSNFQKRTSTGLAGAVTGRGLGGGLASIGGGFAVGKLLADGFNEAKDSIESANKAAVVFGDSYAGIEALGKNSAQALGLTNSKAVEAAATFGNLLRPLGVAEDQAAFFSAGLTQLGADLASFNNTSLEESLTAIRAGLVGENEPLRRFGVQINDAALKAKALALGLYSGKGNLDAYAKSQAAIALIYEQTSLAQGDFARTSGEVANQIKITGANLTNVFGALLKNVLPVVKVGLNGLNVVLDNLTKFINGDVSSALKVLRDGLIGAAAGLGALLAAKAAVEVVQLLGVALKAAVTPMGLLVLAFTGAGAAIAILSKRSESFREFIDNAREAVSNAYEVMREFAIDGIGTLADFFDSTIVPALERFAAFVTGTVIPAVAAIGKRIGELATGAALRTAKFFDTTIIPVLHRVVDVLGELVADGIDYAMEAWERFGPVVTKVADKVVDALGEVKETALDLLSGSKTVLAGIGGAALLGTAVLGPVGTLLAGGAALVLTTFGDEVASGLAIVGDKITAFFEGIDWVALGMKALDFVETLGFILGNLVSDPRFLTAIAAIAAAAVAVGAKFILGFVKGVAENLDELADLGLTIAGALVDAILSNLALSAGLIATVVLGKMFGPKLFAAVAAKLKYEAAFLKLSAADAFGSVFQNIIKPKDFLANMQLSLGEAASTIRSGGGPLKALSASFKAAGQNLGISTGQQIAVGMASALGSALAGQALGKGDVVGGLGGIIASSLAAAAVGGPIVGAAVAGLGAVSAAFSLQAENVKRTKERVDAYKESILSATDPTAAFTNVFKGLGSETKDILAGAGFTIDQLSAAINGNGAALAGTIENVKKFQNENINAEDFKNSDLALRFLNGAVKDYSSATAAAATEAKVLNLATEKSGQAADAAAARYQGMADSIAAADQASTRANIATAIEGVKQKADDALIAFQNANAELIKFLNPDAGTVEETINRVIQSLPGLASQVQGGFDLGGALGQADIDVALAGLDVSIADIVQQGLADGLSTDQIKEKIAGLSVAIGELEVPQEVKDALIGELAEAVLSNQIEVVAVAKTEADTASAEAAAADIVGAVATIVSEYGPSLEAPGKTLSEGVAVGINSGAIKVANAASAIANAAKAAFKKAIESASPSKVFIREGQNIGSGVVIGIDSFMPKVGDASRTMGESVGRKAAEGIRIATDEAKTALGEFISELNEQINGAQFEAIKLALSGGQTLDEARTGVGADLKGVLEAGASIRDSLKEGKGGSFGFSGAEGIENRQSIFGIVDNIKDLAETLFESGSSVQDITAELSFMRQALLDTAGAAGFNREELEALIDSLGLSRGAIDSLASATATAQQQVTDAAAAEKAKADADAQIRADQQAADERDAALEQAAGQTIINNNIVVPYGDLQAVALAVSNRQQSEAARRVRR